MVLLDLTVGRPASALTWVKGGGLQMCWSISVNFEIFQKLCFCFTIL